MSSDVAVAVRGLSKAYTIAHQAEHHTRMGEALAHRLKNPLQRSESETFWALKDVSFDIRRGEVAGILGRNGAGKSTLLKVLSQITEPTSGELRLYGRVGSLLEVGTGFHPELTGRENIFLNGAILGMRRREIERQFDAIIDFAEVERFLDTPVKRYSSGMYVRLAFAVAAHLNPEILVVDEVLAVGDAAFQKKCLGKMGDVTRQGRTVLFVSHNVGAIRSLCNSAVLLDQGQIVMQSDTEKAVRHYLTTNATHSGFWKRPETSPRQQVSYEEMSVVDHHGAIAAHIDSCQPFSIHMVVQVAKDVPQVQLAMRLENQERTPIFTTAHSDVLKSYPTLKQGCYRYTVKIPAYFLPPGTYSITVGAMRPKSKLFDVVEDELTFLVEDMSDQMLILRDGRRGVVNMLLDWHEVIM